MGAAELGVLGLLLLVLFGTKKVGSTSKKTSKKTSSKESVKKDTTANFQQANTKPKGEIKDEDDKKSA